MTQMTRIFTDFLSVKIRSICVIRVLFLLLKSKKMNKISIDTFKNILEKYLYENHPELPDRENQLEKRSLRAVRTYNELTEKGATHETALEHATLELTSGFGFSLFQFLLELSCYFSEISEENRREFCISILSECWKVSDSLSYEGMEDGEAYYYFEGKMEEMIHKNISQLP
jgi:hypothetical protein